MTELFRKHREKIRNGRKGLTLVELIVVIGILAILATTGGVVMGGQIVQARQQSAMNEGSAVRNHINYMLALYSAQENGAGGNANPDDDWFKGGAASMSRDDFNEKGIIELQRAFMASTGNVFDGIASVNITLTLYDLWTCGELEYTASNGLTVKVTDEETVMV